MKMIEYLSYQGSSLPKFSCVPLVSKLQSHLDEGIGADLAQLHEALAECAEREDVEVDIGAEQGGLLQEKQQNDILLLSKKIWGNIHLSCFFYGLLRLLAELPPHPGRDDDFSSTPLASPQLTVAVGVVG